MRPGVNDVGFLVINNNFIGINLGWDFCAEHEWGIDPIKKEFNIYSKLNYFNLGFKARKINKVSKDLVFYFKDDVSYLAYIPNGKLKTKELDSKIMHYNYSKNREIYSSWDERSFGMKSVTDKSSRYLQKLYNAFQKKDIVIFYENFNLLSNANKGLKICIFSNIPKEIFKNAKKVDKDRLKLIKAAKKTGIEKRLSIINKRQKLCLFYCLIPEWSKDKDHTKYNVIFYLNPIDRVNNNSGWFTVEELDQWAHNKGPVPKNLEKGSLYVDNYG